MCRDKEFEIAAGCETMREDIFQGAIRNLRIDVPN